MKKIFFIFLIISFSFFSIVNSQEREAKLNELFNQLKNNNDVTSAFEIEKKYGKFGRSILPMIGEAIG